MHALPLLVMLAAASFSLLAFHAPDLRTRAEITDYEETSTHADVLHLVNGLTSASALARAETFGRSEEGRALPLLMLSEPAVVTPQEARRLGRPVVLVMANIHGGEVEGKEASLILARRLTSGDLRPLLKQLVVLIAPIYNADGNERVSLTNRSSQNGPIAGVGTRENANGLDLNRDFMKLDSAEARALVDLLNRWDPHVVIDLHTTNGSYHGYHLTYAPTLNPNTDERLIAFARDQILASVRETAATSHGIRTYYYGNFASASGGGRESARIDPERPGDVMWRTFDHRPRFGNNYVGLRNRVALLSEAYSYVDFRGRVRATAVFVEESLRTIAARATPLMTLVDELDRESTSVAGGGASRRSSLGVEFGLAAASPDPVEILVGDVRKIVNPRSLREMLVMTDAAVPVRMREYGIFSATRTVTMPHGWLIPRPHVESGRYAEAIDRLRGHGLTMLHLAAPQQVAVERFVIREVTRAERAFQNRHETRLTGMYDKAMLSAQEGGVFIPAAQRLGRLAFYLLEPESDDGLVTWNLIDNGLAPGETYPIYRVLDRPGTLKLTN